MSNGSPFCGLYIYFKAQDPAFTGLVPLPDYIKFSTDELYWSCDANIWQEARTFVVSMEENVSVPFNIRYENEEMSIHSELYRAFYPEFQLRWGDISFNYTVPVNPSGYCYCRQVVWVF